MAYRNVDTEAYKKFYAKKKIKSKSKKKPLKISSMSIDQRVQTAKMKRQKKKKYAQADTGDFARSKKAMTSDKAYALPFGETFRQAKKAGKETFRWKSKQYHTKTKEELEKATGTKERERFERAAKSKDVTKKRTLRERLTGFATQAGYGEDKAARIKAKRIAKMEERKAAGKSYSKKNLAALKAS